jgi:hypothetical protein
VPPDPPDLAGYRIYWRLTTAAEWNHASFARDVAKSTLENVIIDNWLFAVSSWSGSGFKSPIVFPGQAGVFLAEPPGH